MSVEAFGLGVRPSEDASLETLQALERCDAVFSDLDEESGSAWLARLLPNAVFGASADRVAREGAGKRAGLAVWGHAHHASRFAREVSKACSRRSVPFVARPSNSPLGRAVAATATFIGAEGYFGIVGHDLDEVLARPERLDGALPLAVWAKSAPKERWAELARALTAACGPRRAAVALPVSGPRRVELRVSRLGELSGGAVVLVQVPRGARRAP